MRVRHITEWSEFFYIACYFNRVFINCLLIVYFLASLLCHILFYLMGVKLVMLPPVVAFDKGIHYHCIYFFCVRRLFLVYFRRHKDVGNCKGFLQAEMLYQSHVCCFWMTLYYLYWDALGQLINLDKLTVSFSKNVSQVLKGSIAGILNIPIVNVHDKYLGCQELLVSPRLRFSGDQVSKGKGC
ncbi:hypothetical protein ACH5RR_030026 [Cinchona calisaya]|uniref:Uncharacterized protein n=1 Tax=Cinchona calisaya TaxID=153742 RepID=A0ABD2YX70_9GENT